MSQTAFHSRSIRDVELDKILAMLAQETTCADAAALAGELTPVSQPDEAQYRLQETDDAFVLMARFGAPSFYGLTNVTNALRRAEAGGVLNLPEFLAVNATLHAVRALRDWRAKSEGMKTVLDGRFETLYPNKYLEERIEMTVQSEEEVADTASPTLAAIRRKINQASLRVREQLDKMRRSGTYQKYLQESIVTMREGRFVVPVKAEYRSEVPGLVHDTSGSGATVFIEPMAVVEANNEIKVLRAQEKDEIDRILAELSAQTGEFADAIITGYNSAVSLNLVFAKARLAYKMKAVMPKVNTEGRVELRRARHPLIAEDKVVPIDIELGKSFDTLVITGPNTGGKTVSLKTVGLFCMMAMCGLMIPADTGSEIALFNRVLTDIGDEQSIEQSLSTFSAHMTNIISILKEADENSLVLLDELGAGTDPVEGAALAQAILEELRLRGAHILSTTHYAELKAYALQTPGVENGCCEFDVSTLRPTYRLLIGVPGRSNAFAISKRLGMEDSIVERARGLVSEESSEFENVVENLEKSRLEMEAERARAADEHEAARKAAEEAARQRETLEKQAAQALEKAREEASRIVAATRAQADALLEELEAARKARNKELSAEQKAKLKAGMRSLENVSDPVRRARSNAGYVLPRKLAVGDTVLIYDIDKKATVLDLPKTGDLVLVQAGLIKTRVRMGNLRLLENNKISNGAQPQKRTRTVTKELSARTASLEVDLRGQTVEEALMNLDSFIDHAQLNGQGQITVIHGKGTGALRAAVQQHLRSHPSIKSFRLGVFGEGENGVTIAELK